MPRLYNKENLGKQNYGTVRSHLKLVAYCEITYEKGWTKGTNRCSWPFRISISPERESQRDCGLFSKPVHFSWPVWGKPWVRVETKTQSLLASVGGTPSGKVRPYVIQKLVKTLKLRTACGLDGILNECLRHLWRRPLVHLTHLFNHCVRLSHFPKPWKEAKFITLPKPGKDLKFPQNLRPIRFLSTTGKLLKKVILKIAQRHIEERGLFNASQLRI
jgi:hypothetical protein